MSEKTPASKNSRGKDLAGKRPSGEKNLAGRNPAGKRPSTNGKISEFPPYPKYIHFYKLVKAVWGVLWPTPK